MGLSFGDAVSRVAFDFEDAVSSTEVAPGDATSRVVLCFGGPVSRTRLGPGEANLRRRLGVRGGIRLGTLGERNWQFLNLAPISTDGLFL